VGADSKWSFGENFLSGSLQNLITFLRLYIHYFCEEFRWCCWTFSGNWISPCGSPPNNQILVTISRLIIVQIAFVKWRSRKTMQYLLRFSFGASHVLGLRKTFRALNISTKNQNSRLHAFHRMSTFPVITTFTEWHRQFDARSRLMRGYSQLEMVTFLPLPRPSGYMTLAESCSVWQDNTIQGVPPSLLWAETQTE